jgi:isopenicillin N synthase-like dioxygenase
VCGCTGIDAKAFSRAFEAGKAFFALPSEEKLRCAANDGAYGFFPRAMPQQVIVVRVPALHSLAVMRVPSRLLTLTPFSASLGSERRGVKQKSSLICEKISPWAHWMACQAA